MDMNEITEHVTGDERLLLLAMALDTRVGLTFEEIAGRGLLGDPSKVKTESLRHTFLLYRKQLEEIGVRIIESEYLGIVRYRVDAHLTYADARDVHLTNEEALTLVTVLTLYLKGSNAPYVDDVRRARDKIASIAGLSRGTVTDGGVAMASYTNREHSELLKALDDRHPVSFDYTNARGVSERKTVALYGIFERREHTYVVGRDDTNSPALSNPVKVFRCDRMAPRSIAINMRRTYDIPTDFCVHDFMRLPFQYGDEQPFIATFGVKEAVSTGDGHPTKLDGLTMGKGVWTSANNGNYQQEWSVEANDSAGLAQWAARALSEGLVLISPPEIVNAVMEGLRTAEVSHA